jgi:hypothetical protein
MSQLYGLLAGVFVCVSSWGAMTYISEQVGWLIGVFLLMFFTVTTVYINGDEVNERQKNVSKSLSDMEIILFQKLKMIEQKIDYLEEKFGNEPAADTRSEVQGLDDIIGMVNQILANQTESP